MRGGKTGWPRAVRGLEAHLPVRRPLSLECSHGVGSEEAQPEGQPVFPRFPFSQFSGVELALSPRAVKPRLLACFGTACQ